MPQQEDSLRRTWIGCASNGPMWKHQGKFWKKKQSIWNLLILGGVGWVNRMAFHFKYFAEFIHDNFFQFILIKNHLASMSFRAVMCPAALIWLLRKRQNRFLVGSARRSLALIRLRRPSRMSALASLILVFSEARSAWSCFASFGSSKLILFARSLARTFLALMRSITCLGSFFPRFFFLTFRPKHFNADWLMVSDMWGSIWSELSVENCERGIRAAAWFSWSWYS